MIEVKATKSLTGFKWAMNEKINASYEIKHEVYNNVSAFPGVFRYAMREYIKEYVGLQEM